MNKTMIIILCILAGTGTLHSQTQKGNQLLGGSFSFGTSKGTSDYNYQSGSYTSIGNSTVKASSFYIGPGYSYFIADNLDLGVNAGFGNVKSTNTYSYINNYSGPTETFSRSVSAAVFLRKYFLYRQKFGVRTGPFAQYQYSSYKYSYLEPQPSVDYSQTVSQSGRNLNAGLGLDIIYFPIRRLGIASALGALAYNHSDIKGINNHDKSDGFSLSLTSVLNFSFFYCFGK